MMLTRLHKKQSTSLPCWGKEVELHGLSHIFYELEAKTYLSKFMVVVSGSYQLGQKDQFIIPVNSPSVYSSGTDIESPKQIDFTNLRDNLHPKLQNQEHQHGNLSHEELEFLSASDEEVIGVITLEDVMEELIQVMNKLSFS